MKRLIVVSILIFAMITCLQVTNVRGGGNSEEKVVEPEETTHPIITTLLYIPNRIFDLMDIFRINIGIGPGGGINLRATKLVQAGIESYHTVRCGIKRRRVGIPYFEDMNGFGVGPVYLKAGNPDRQFTEVGLTFHALFIGAEAAISLEEIADFFLGFFLIDFKKDDYELDIFEKKKE